MAKLVVLGFDSKEKAEDVFRIVSDELPKQELLTLEDSALVWRDSNGKVKIQQSMSTTGAGAAGGAFWGTLVGLLFLAPVAGMAVGAATGAVAGKLSDIGINDDMIKQIGNTLEPGKAAVFALVIKSTPDRVIEILRPYNPNVLQTSLSQESQEELVKALHTENTSTSTAQTDYSPAGGTQ